MEGKKRKKDVTETDQKVKKMREKDRLRTCDDHVS
jgi:hypothetical protein